MKFAIYDEESGEPTIAWWVVALSIAAILSLPFIYYLQHGHF